MKKAIITGITGQDGSYLAEHLLNQGYIVHGLVRRTSLFNRARIEHLRMENARLILHYGDLSDMTSIRRMLRQVKPDEVYHLAGQSHVGLSFEISEITCLENGVATLGLLEALRDLEHEARFYLAASSEVFGVPQDVPQTEGTPFNPVNPYGCAKAFAVQICRVFRRAHGMFACTGIAYNHESPRRGENFVTRKISLGAARIKAGRQDALRLGNLDAKRDWGFAPEYVVAMWQALQADKPRDYILATGQTFSIRQFAIAAFEELGVNLEFESTGSAEFARRKDTGEVVITVDPRYFRPAEPRMLVGDASLAKQFLGWQPLINGVEVARRMTSADFENCN